MSLPDSVDDPCANAHPPSDERRIAEAQANLIVAEHKLRRQQVLWENAAISTRDVDEARAEWRAARRDLARAVCRAEQFVLPKSLKVNRRRAE
jgi:multidrug resistance efflux pump